MLITYECCGVRWVVDENHFRGNECLLCGKEGKLIEPDDNEEAFCDNIP
jgi:hypothetical protein